MREFLASNLINSGLLHFSTILVYIFHTESCPVLIARLALILLHENGRFEYSFPFIPSKNVKENLVLLVYSE